jgi:hypothetical protein
MFEWWYSGGGTGQQMDFWNHLYHFHITSKRGLWTPFPLGNNFSPGFGSRPSAQLLSGQTGYRLTFTLEGFLSCLNVAKQSWPFIISVAESEPQGAVLHFTAGVPELL